MNVGIWCSNSGNRLHLTCGSNTIMFSDECPATKDCLPWLEDPNSKHQLQEPAVPALQIWEAQTLEAGHDVRGFGLFDSIISISMVCAACRAARQCPMCWQATASQLHQAGVHIAMDQGNGKTAQELRSLLVMHCLHEVV